MSESAAEQPALPLDDGPGQERKQVLAAVVLAAVMSFIGLGSSSLWAPDEPRVAGIGRAMYDSGDFAAARLNGELFLEMPPLYWWAQVLGFKLLGVSDWSARLPSALFGTLTLLVAFVMGKEIGGARVGLVSLAVLATIFGYFKVMHQSLVDPALIFFVSLSHLGFLYWHAPGASGRGRLGAGLVAAAVPLSFLAKGLVGVGLSLGPPFLYLLSTRQFRAIARSWRLAALLAPAFALVVGSWLAYLARTCGLEAVREFIIDENILRFLGRSHAHQHPFWFYLTKAGDLLPWLLALPAMLSAGAWGRDKDRAAEWRRALFAIFLFGLLLLSLSSAKRGLYLVPIFPAFAVTAGWWLGNAGLAGAGLKERGGRLGRPTLVTLLLGLALFPAGLIATAAIIRFAPLAVDYPLEELRRGLSTARILALAAAALPATGFLLGALARHLRAGSMPRPAQILTPLCIYFLAFQACIRPILDRVETLHPLTQALAGAFPAGAPVAAYMPGEEFLGIIYFDLQRPVLVLNAPAEVRDYLAAAPGRHLVYEKQRAKQLPEDVLSNLSEIYNDSATADTPYVISGWRGEVKPP